MHFFCHPFLYVVVVVRIISLIYIKNPIYCGWKITGFPSIMELDFFHLPDMKKLVKKKVFILDTIICLQNDAWWLFYECLTKSRLLSLSRCQFVFICEKFVQLFSIFEVIVCNDIWKIWFRFCGKFMHSIFDSNGCVRWFYIFLIQFITFHSSELFALAIVSFYFFSHKLHYIMCKLSENIDLSANKTIFVCSLNIWLTKSIKRKN